MRHFEITGKLTNGDGETVSITVYNKKSGDIFYVGLEQVEDLIDLVQRNLTSAMHSDGEDQCVCPAGVGICGFGDPDTNICNYRRR